MLGHRHKLWSHIFLRAQDRNRANAIGWVALGVMIICASTYSTFARQISSHFAPISLIFIGESLSLFFVFLTFGFVPTFKKLLSLDRIYLETILLMGLLCSLIAPILWFKGLATSTATNAALLNNSEIIVMSVLSTLFLSEKLTSTKILALFTILAGLCVVGIESLNIGFDRFIGDMYIILAASIIGGGGVLFRAKLRHIDPEIVMTVRSLMAISGFFIMSPFLEWSFSQQLQAFPLVLIPALLGFAFLGRFLNIFCFYEALKRLPVTAMSIAINFPIFGALIFASVYLGEKVNGYHILASVLIVGGSVLLELSTPKEEAHNKPEELVTQSA
jgi:drug/metabolite transporter (DMT)-like permease